MKQCALMSVLLALGCLQVQAAPVEQGGVQPGSCDDAVAKSAAGLALNKINHDRKEGYVLGLHRLSNVHMKMHGENGIVFHLTLDVVETNCSVLSKKEWNSCEARPDSNTPVYGQCKASIFINRVNRVVRLYKYDCTIRPVPVSKVNEACPDCPSLVSLDNPTILETVSLAVAKFNHDSSLSKRFALLKVTRASSGMGGMSMYYNAEFTIQETTCNSSVAETADCPVMDCEFSHKGFCKASNWIKPTKDIDVSVECEIYEPEAAERQKKLHLLGGETDHSHSDTHAHSATHDVPHAADASHTHDHVHDHTKSHDQHVKTEQHAADAEHHHTHDHAAGSAHRHSHDHSHDHGHGHDHVHTHHAKAHDHSHDSPNHHHDYKHPEGTHTHEHDHELALDHDHKHAHLHEHEHHHHHHHHEHETGGHDHPQGEVRMLASMDQPMTLPSFPDTPAAGPEVGVTLPLKPDPEIPGEMEPVIDAFPAGQSPQCVKSLVPANLVDTMFAEDPLFKVSA